MRLLDLLKAAAGQASLHSPLGRWHQAVSAQLDSSEETAPSYCEVARVTTDQNIANLASDERLVFNAQTGSEGTDITYNPATGVFTLQPGLYELDGRTEWDGFGATSAIVRVIWGDSENGTPLVNYASGRSAGNVNDGNLAPQSTVKVIYRATVVTVAVLRASGGTGSAQMTIGSHALVRKIG